MPIKSFRNKLVNNTIDTIHLHTNTGTTGYRIKKLQVMFEDPMTGNTEGVIKVYAIPQDTASAQVDFSDNTLLAAAYVSDSASWGGNLPQMNAVFDNVTFNQDIFVTYRTAAGTDDCNYYIELETVKLSLDENTVATLKDIRNISRNAD